ncbi:MAG: hypothetical protein WA891_19645 [Acidobacteriaceae bacterium]
MDTKPSISVAVLEQALAATRDRIASLQADAEELERAIRQLQGGGSVVEEQIDDEKAASFTEVQELAVEDDEEYPAEKYTSMTRIEIAVALAKCFDGYLATGAFRKVLSKPGVLKSTSQVSSVASRVLANSDEFTRVWEGLYKLKNYSPNGKVYAGGAVPVGGATQ